MKRKSSKPFRGCKKSADRIKQYITKGSTGVKILQNPKNSSESKNAKNDVLCYEQTSPLDVLLYAFGFSLSVLHLFFLPPSKKDVKKAEANASAFKDF